MMNTEKEAAQKSGRAAAEQNASRHSGPDPESRGLGKALDPCWSLSRT
jgi:hypothetical protein